MNNRNYKNAFTLVELLAVIVIIGILLVIGVTAVQKVMERSKESVFLADAKMYIKTAKYKQSMSDSDISFYTIGIDNSLSEYKLDGDAENDGISPYGTKYEGYVIARKLNDKVQYSIFLKDGKESEPNAMCNAIGFVSSNVHNYYTEEDLDESIIISTKCSEFSTVEVDTHYVEFVAGEISNITANILTLSGSESETIAINNNGSGELTVTNLLERGSRVFLKTCEGDINTKKYEECLTAFSVLINTADELYLFERPLTDDKLRQMNFKSIKEEGSEKLQTIPYMTKKYQTILTKNIEDEDEKVTVRLLTLNDIYNVLNNNYLTKEMLLQFSNVFVPFQWWWVNSGEYKWGVCSGGGVYDSEKNACVWSPKAYEKKEEAQLRSYSNSSYWISGKNSDLSADIEILNSFSCSSSANSYTSKCPYICLNEMQLLNVEGSNTKSDIYDPIEYSGDSNNSTKTRHYYAYYVVKAKNEAFKDKLYCMNDEYNGFELCNESNEHN